MATTDPSSGERDRDLERILSELNGSPKEDRWISGLEISKRLRDNQGVAVHWRTIDSLLGRNLDLVSRKKRNRRWEYVILAAGRDLLGEKRDPIVLVDPSRALLATLDLHQFLGSLEGLIRVCDPYLDGTTLEHLEACPKGVEVRILSQTVRDSGTVRRLLAAATVSGYQFAVRKQAQGLHDRYVIDKNTMTILGTSLNGFGKKQSFVVTAGEDVRRVMAQEFDRLWRQAPVWK